MTWAVLLHEAFDAELDDLPEEVQDEVLALMGLLKHFGPVLGRPRVDTLKGSRLAAREHEGTAVRRRRRRMARRLRF